MRKRWCLLILIAALFLMACSKNNDPYVILVNKTEYTIAPRERTITGDGTTMRYSMYGFLAGDWGIHIQFDDGSEYSASDGNSVYVRGHLSEEERGLAEELTCHLKEKIPENEPKSFGAVLTIVLVCLIIIGIGAFMAWQPYFVWEIQHLFCVKNGEPTDYALWSNRIGGILFILVGIVMMIKLLTL